MTTCSRRRRAERTTATAGDLRAAGAGAGRGELMPRLVLLFDDDGPDDPAEAVHALLEGGSWTPIDGGWFVTLRADPRARNRDRQRRYRDKKRNAQPLRDRNAEALRDPHSISELPGGDISHSRPSRAVVSEIPHAETVNNQVGVTPSVTAGVTLDRNADVTADRNAEATLRLKPQYDPDGTARSNQPWQMEPVTDAERAEAKAQTAAILDTMRAQRERRP